MTAAALMASTGGQGSQVFGLSAFQVTKEERPSLQFEFPHWRDDRIEISRVRDRSIQNVKQHGRYGRQRERIQFQPASKLRGDVSVPMTAGASILTNGSASMRKEKH